MKRILGSLAVLVAVGVIVGGATIAFYNDTETSTGNIFTAGSVDLKVDHLRQTYNGVDCETCSVAVFSSGSTQVVASSEDAFDQGPFPHSAVEVANPHPNWEDEGNLAPAQWIWVADSTNGVDTTNDAEYTFENRFHWNGTVEDVDLDLGLAADNGYKIILNGTTIVDELDEEHNYGTAVNALNGQEVAFANAIVMGENILQIIVRNHDGVASPASNPAGLLFSLTIERNDEECLADSEFQQACMLWSETDLDGSQRFFSFGDIKPGDWGTNVISLHSYTNDAWACLLAHDGEDNENGVQESEGDDTEENGELQDYLNFFSWIDNGDGAYDPQDETALGTSTLGDLGSIASFDSGNGLQLTGTTTAYIGLAWCAGDVEVNEETGEVSCDGSGMGNDAQSDSFGASLTAYAEQVRNNPDFACSSVDLDEEEEDLEIDVQ